MTTTLTETGWVFGGNQIGTWTEQADRVIREDEIRIGVDITVNTLAGDDSIVAGSEFGIAGIGILNRGTINTGEGNDSITGSIKSTALATGLQNNGTITTGKGSDIVSGVALEGLGGRKEGIINGGTIDTGKGSDIVRGIVQGANAVGIQNLGTILTGKDSDFVVGNASGMGSGTGIRNFLNGTINTGEGNDHIIGAGVTSGIVNESNSTIDTGEGNDYITGRLIDGINGTGRGITNSGVIKTGDGEDIVDGLTGGFSSSLASVGVIELGEGDDLVRGYGRQIIDGGSGYDTAELGIDYDQSLFSLGSSSDIQIGDMTFNNVERFVFNDTVYSLQELQPTI